MYSYSFSAWMPALIVRTYGLSPADSGLWLGVVILLTAPVGVMTGSIISQKLRGSYGNGAALRVGVIANFSALIPAMLLTLAPTFWLGLLLIGVTQFLITLPFGVAPAALHEVTPNQYRGQIIAIYLFFINLIGLGLGPLFVGLITDYVFGDESMLRYSMLIIAVVLLPLSGFILARSTITFLDFKESV